MIVYEYISYIIVYEYITLSNLIYIYIYIYIYITNLPVNTLVTLSHLWSRDNQGHESFLAPSADKITLNY